MPMGKASRKKKVSINKVLNNQGRYEKELIMAGSYSVGTVNRNNAWLNNFNLWSDTVKKSPDSAMAHNNLGTEYASRGLLDTSTSR